MIKFEKEIGVEKKIKDLRENLQGMQNILVAYSGGVDSTFLLKIAQEELKNRVIAVTIKTEVHTAEEISRAKKMAQRWGIKHLVKEFSILNNPEFVKNPLERCYICKREIFQIIQEIAKANHIKYIVDGSNYSDLNDFRPGLRALRELKIKSPLQEVFLSKEEIRLASKEMNLSNWNKPSNSCLATRVPYYEEINQEKLTRIEQSEDFLHQLGIEQVRVRCHDKLARIEVTEKDIPRLMNKKNRKEIISQLKSIGFTYCSLDLAAYPDKVENKNSLKKGKG
ncbi:MAG: ATP-dependent sacrificial sulfur transferase LarE [Candidatus Caldatribacteriota bacterium]